MDITIFIVDLGMALRKNKQGYIPATGTKTDDTKFSQGGGQDMPGA